MNIFKKIKYKKNNSIDLDRKKINIFRKIFIDNQINLVKDKNMYVNAIPYIGVNEEKKLGFNKNLPKPMHKFLFSGLMQLFLGININTDKDGMNVTTIIKDFDRYFFYKDGFVFHTKKIKKWIFIGISLGLAILFGGLWYFLYKMKFPELMQGGFFSGKEDMFNNLYVIYGSLFITISIIYSSYFIFNLIFNKLIKNKIFFLQNLIDAYLMNTLIYHYIMNSYNSEKKILKYFYYKGILKNIIEKLKRDNLINEDEYILYLIYLNNTKNAYTIIKNNLIGEILNNYYNISKTGENKGYYTVEKTIRTNFIMKQGNLLEIMEGEFQKITAYSRFTQLSILTAIMLFIPAMFLFILIPVLQSI